MFSRHEPYEEEYWLTDSNIVHMNLLWEQEEKEDGHEFPALPLSLSDQTYAACGFWILRLWDASAWT